MAYEYRACERPDGTHLLLVTFVPDAIASEVLSFRHDNGLFARVFVGKSGEPIAIRLRGVFKGESGDDTEEENAIVAGQKLEKFADGLRSLSVFLIALAKHQNLLDAGSDVFNVVSNRPVRKRDECDYPEIQLSAEIAGAADEIFSARPRNLLLCGAR